MNMINCVIMLLKVNIGTVCFMNKSRGGLISLIESYEERMKNMDNTPIQGIKQTEIKDLMYKI